jgi:hypothetical protein
MMPTPPRCRIPRAALAALFAAPSLVYAQKEILVEGKPTCPKCTIELVRIATVNPTDSVPTVEGWVIRSSKGHFFFGSEQVNGAVLEYSASGKLVRKIGRFGKGPGEILSVARIAVGVGDTLYVLDGGLKRVSVFSPEGEHVRSVSINTDRPTQFVAAPDGAIIVTDPWAKDRCFLILDHSASVTYAGGSCITPEGGAGVFSIARWLAPVGNGRFWAARVQRYQLDEWTYKGELTRVIKRKIHWFEPVDPSSGLAPGPGVDKPPSPQITAVAGLDQRLVQVTTVRPSGEWAPIEKDATGNWLPGEARKKYITTFEVIDTESGKLVASHEIRGREGLDTKGRYVATQRVDEKGDAFLDIYEIVFRRN